MKVVIRVTVAAIAMLSLSQAAMANYEVEAGTSSPKLRSPIATKPEEQIQAPDGLAVVRPKWLYDAKAMEDKFKPVAYLGHMRRNPGWFKYQLPEGKMLCAPVKIKGLQDTRGVGTKLLDLADTGRNTMIYAGPYSAAGSVATPFVVGFTGRK